MASRLKRRPGRPRTTGKNEMIAIRWPRAMIKGIDRYRTQQKLEKRGDALRQIVFKFLSARGLYRHTDTVQL